MAIRARNMKAVLEHIGDEDLKKILRVSQGGPNRFFAKYGSEPPRSRASLICDQELIIAREEFSGPGYNVIDQGGRPFVSIRDEVNVWFRKSTPRGRPIWNKTEFASHYANQEDLNTPTLFPKAVHLVATYQLNALGTKVIACALSCWKGGQLLWDKPLIEDGLGEQGMLDFSPSKPVVGPTIKVRKKTRKKDISERNSNG